MTENINIMEIGLTAIDGEPKVRDMDIADLCGTRHNQVVETIIRLFEKGVLRESRKTTRTVKPDGGGRPMSVYDLTKRDSLVVVSAYDDEVRARVIDRWMYLETAAAGPNPKFSVPQTFAEALRLAAEQTEKVEKQALVIAELAPKAEFHDDVAEAVNAQDYQAVAKVFGTGRTRFTRWLKAKKITIENLRPYQRYEDAGYFRVVERKRKDPITGESIIYTKTLVTGKGVIYLQKKWNEDMTPGRGV
ncbi:phage antirepressor KilAC domain-containing protein [Brucella sp. 191011898]|uniref:phage antirepressor KilAC domain-containing protein n=1 Tax=Brucella sp. 191011898 TaxID=2730447 RepID=UPI0015DE9009|nr:phage antirepressor KilAC domain-containing protein [Brucella sp. 191011898]CAB4324929.1 hypothetical protein BCH_00143 [Brucella sp. 191011898]